MEAKALKNLGHSCFLNSTVQAILGIPAVSAVLSTIESTPCNPLTPCRFSDDFALREGLRKVHIDRRSECIDRMRTVLQTAMYVPTFGLLFNILGTRVVGVLLEALR